jgi:hypothetical protein
MAKIGGYFQPASAASTHQYPSDEAPELAKESGLLWAGYAARCASVWKARPGLSVRNDGGGENHIVERTKNCAALRLWIQFDQEVCRLKTIP